MPLDGQTLKEEGGVEGWMDGWRGRQRTEEEGGVRPVPMTANQLTLSNLCTACVSVCVQCISLAFL